MLGCVHEQTKFGEPGAELIGDPAPLGAGGLRVVLGESRGDEGRDGPSAALAGMGQRVAHEIRAKHLGDCRLDALMRVADHQLDPAQPAARELAQELRPERLRLGLADIEAQNLAADIAVDTDGNDGGDRDDPIVLANL